MIVDSKKENGVHYFAEKDDEAVRFVLSDARNNSRYKKWYSDKD